MKNTYIAPETCIFSMTVVNAPLAASTDGLSNKPGQGGEWQSGGASVGTKEDNDWDIW